MKRAKAPDGFHTVVDITVYLEGRPPKIFIWSTPLAIMLAFHMAPRWAKDQMQQQRTPGRSKISALVVDVRTETGRFRK